MKSYLCLLYSFLLLSCASTSSTNKSLLYFIPGDNVNNDQYFASVQEYFTSNGINIPSENVKEYTASIFIGTLPPQCDVYVDNIYMGKTSHELYLKPGTISITFKKRNLSKTFTLELQEGKNQGKFYKIM
jgi:hypothetical protein